MIRVRSVLWLMTILIFANAATKAEESKEKKEKQKWIRLFDSKSLDGWKPTEFGGEGEVYVENGEIILGFGSSATGITLNRDFPKENYEISLEARRIEGIDFFCGLTFPVGKDHCSLILGGWGGAVVGLSTIDDEDASENATNQVIVFKKNQWYKTRVRVTDKNIVVWLDDKQIINQSRKNHKISIRPEVDLCRPLGIASWDTKAGIKNVQYRTIK